MAFERNDELAHWQIGSLQTYLQIVNIAVFPFILKIQLFIFFIGVEI